MVGRVRRRAGGGHRPRRRRRRPRPLHRPREGDRQSRSTCRSATSGASATARPCASTSSSTRTAGGRRSAHEHRLRRPGGGRRGSPRERDGGGARDDRRAPAGASSSSSGCFASRRDGRRSARPAAGRSSSSSPAGRGTLLVGGAEHALEADTGAFLVPGDRWAIDNPGPDDLVLVSVTAPCEGQRRSAGHSPLRRPAFPAGDAEPRVPASRRQGARLPRRHPVRRPDPSGPRAACTATPTTRSST